MSVYTKNVWVDNVSPVDKAHMDVIENGVFASQFRDEKGVANGYASLDATGKVPVAQALPTVVNGQWLKGSGGAAVWAAITAADLPPQAVPGYSTTLPASPVDGQEHILVDSLTGFNFLWHLRFNSGSASAYKWEFIGGISLRTNGTGFGTLTADGTYKNYSMGVTAPRAGDYRVQYTAVVNNVGAGPGAVYCHVAVGAGSVVPVAQTGGLYYALPNTNAGALAMNTMVTGVAAGQVVAEILSAVTGMNVQIGLREFHITPVRVA